MDVNGKWEEERGGKGERKEEEKEEEKRHFPTGKGKPFIVES